MSPLASWLFVAAVLFGSSVLMVLCPLAIAGMAARLEDAEADLGTDDPAPAVVDPPTTLPTRSPELDDVMVDNLVGVDVDAPIPYSVTAFGELASEVITPGPLSDADWEAYLAETPPEQRPGWTLADELAVRQLLDGPSPC